MLPQALDDYANDEPIPLYAIRDDPEYVGLTDVSSDDSSEATAKKAEPLVRQEFPETWIWQLDTMLLGHRLVYVPRGI